MRGGHEWAGVSGFAVNARATPPQISLPRAARSADPGPMNTTDSEPDAQVFMAPGSSRGWRHGLSGKARGTEMRARQSLNRILIGPSALPSTICRT